MTRDPPGGDRDNEGDAQGEWWFAQQLGERWQTDGDGIYRLVEVPAPPIETAEDTAAKDDLVDAIQPSRAIERSARRRFTAGPPWPWLRR